MSRIEISLPDLRALQARVDRKHVAPGDWAVLGALVGSLITRTEARIARLRAKADRPHEGEPASGSSACGAAPSDGTTTAGDDGEPRNDEITPAPPSNGAQTDEDHEADEVDAGTDTAAPKGHGRNGAAAFTAAKDHLHTLALGVLGALCAACGIGRMSPYRDKVIVQITGQSNFGAERHRFQQARCRLCGAILTADGMAVALDGIGTSYITYHWSACAMLIVLHYFAGGPFKRLEALHRGWGVPMPDANQWHLADRCDDLLTPLYRAAERDAILHAINLRIDDTGAVIIELSRQIQDELAALQRLGESTRNVRTGINATAVYLETDHGRVVLFFTGRHHAGEIIDRLLAHRRSIAKPAAPKLVKVTDAASKNFDHAQHDLLDEAVCNAHAFLKFRAIKDAFPVEYALAGEVYKKVFDNDDEAKARGLSPVERMDFHRSRSKPEMERLWQRCKQALAVHLVEPHSPLWEPVSFVINQWDRLTRFCHIPGVPLDTNVVEQTLIIPVRYLAGSFGYKTQNGADVGDRHMSLVATANANGVEPVAYLTHCLANHRDLAERPEHYLPWAYKQRLEAASARGAQPVPAARSPVQRHPHPLSVPPPIGPPPPATRRPSP